MSDEVHLPPPRALPYVHPMKMKRMTTRTSRTGVRRMNRAKHNQPLVMPEPIRESNDAMEPAFWLGARSTAAIRELTSHRLFRGILGRIVNNESSPRIVYWLWEQVPADDPLGPKNIAAGTLIKRIDGFRKLLPQGVLVPKGWLDAKFQRLDAELDEIAELDTLIRYQKSRLEILAAKEHEFAMPLDVQRREVETLAVLLQRRFAMRAGVLGTTVIANNLNMAQQQVVMAESTALKTVADFMENKPEGIPGLMAAFDAVERQLEEVKLVAARSDAGSSESDAE